MCFLAYKLCMLFVLRFPWLQCNSKELWFMRISKSGLRKFSVIYLVLICCIPCTGKSVDSHEITEKLYTVYTIPSWMSYSWDPVLSSSWKTSTKNNFKSLHFLLYKCFLWLWETGCAKKKKKKKCTVDAAAWFWQLFVWISGQLLWYCILYLQSMQVSLKGALCWTV